MRKRLTVALLAFSVTSFAQDTTYQLITIIRASFFNPGISYETPIDAKHTIYVQGSLSTAAYYASEGSYNTSEGISFDPAFAIQYRYYYNRQKREVKGKRTTMNSLNYIAPMVEVLFSRAFVYSYKREPVYHFGAVWGLQRNFAKRFSLDVNIGPGIVYAKRYSFFNRNRYGKKYITDLTLLNSISVGFWLNKQK